MLDFNFRENGESYVLVSNTDSIVLKVLFNILEFENNGFTFNKLSNLD